MLDQSVIDGLRARYRGPLLQEGDEGYDAARTIWNGMIDRRPALIARCRGAADVIDAVNFARDNAMPVSIRGGGHNVRGTAVSEGGLMIDLSLMRSARVDLEKRTVRAEGGCIWEDVDRECSPFGLHTPGGSVSETGIGGLSLGGGMGYLSGQFGLTVDNIVSVDLVTADGEFLTASADDHQDLFWGLRGGGGNFGVATAIEYRLHEIRTTVQSGFITYPAEKAKQVMTTYRDFLAETPDDMDLICALHHGPDGTPLISVVVVVFRDQAESDEILRPFRDLGPIAETVAETPYVEAQKMMNPAAPEGWRYYRRSALASEMSDAGIDTAIELFGSVPSPLTMVFFQRTGNASTRVDPTATAFPHRDAIGYWGALSAWQDPADDEANIAWTREYGRRMQPFGLGAAYVTDLGGDGTSDELKEAEDAYGANYRRISALKQKYDPQNMFSLNPNVRPSELVQA
jgi:FAD/FMN-containing dehydrogenase